MHRGNPEPVTSESLIHRVRHDDQDAWQRFFEIYAPVVYSRCRRFGLSDEDSADLTQETMVKISNSTQRFPVLPERKDEASVGDDHGDGKEVEVVRDQPVIFRRWLRTVTVNAVRDYFRKQKLRFVDWDQEQLEALSVSFLDPDSESVLRIPEDTISVHFPRSQSEDDRILAAAMRARRGRIMEKNWQAFWRTVIEEKSDNEVAEELGMTPKAVRQARYETLRALRADVEDLIHFAEKQKAS